MLHSYLSWRDNDLGITQCFDIDPVDTQAEWPRAARVRCVKSSQPQRRAGVRLLLRVPACSATQALGLSVRKARGKPVERLPARVWKVSCTESHPHSAIACSEGNTPTKRKGRIPCRFRVPNAACSPVSEGALARAGMISPLLRGWLRSQGSGTTSLRFSNARVMPCSLAAIQVPPAPSPGYTAVVAPRW